MKDGRHTPRILVVEDDLAMARVLELMLGRAGYGVSAVSSASEAERLVSATPVDLVILDIGLPDRSGLALLKSIPPDSRVLIVSGKGSAEARALGLELGADDYLAKPFHTRELLARVDALMRRRAPRADAAAPPGQDRAEWFDGLVLYRGERRLIGRDGLPIHLTSAEWEVLLALSERPGIVRTRDFLFTRLYQRPWDVNDRSIDQAVSRLRRKIEREPDRPQLVQSIRGHGYMFAA
jgi:two-component system phosphate regulon response regulator OmpR